MDFEEAASPGPDPKSTDLRYLPGETNLPFRSPIPGLESREEPRGKVCRGIDRPKSDVSS